MLLHVFFVQAQNAEAVRQCRAAGRKLFCNLLFASGYVFPVFFIDLVQLNYCITTLDSYAYNIALFNRKSTLLYSTVCFGCLCKSRSHLIPLRSEERRVGKEEVFIIMVD